MEVKTFVFLQIAVFIALGLHSASAGSNQPSASHSSPKSMEVEYCSTNCTKGTDKTWSGCSDLCMCVHVGNSTKGRCLKLSGDYDYMTEKIED
uniref:Putative basic tail protein n=1 Tax=Ixodes ricinus TaxID=34613 RepID=A0A0K8RL74_IXORI